MGGERRRAARPSPAGRGPSLAVVPSWGAPSSGLDSLWGARDPLGLASGQAFEPGRWVDAEVAYGFGVLDSAFTGAPYAALGVSDTARDLRLGYRLSLARPNASDFALSLEGVLRDRSGDGSPEHGVALRARLRW